MKVLLFNDKGPMRLAAYTKNVHAFVYQWGVTVRFRVRDDWRHVALRVEAERYPHPSRGRVILSAETWRTVGGTTERLRFSKKYAKVKVLA